MTGTVEDYNIRDFLNNKSIDNYCIPELQRDYVWQSENVIDLLDGIKQGFDNNDNEYHIGFITAYRDQLNKSRYMLIDGQQRVTTVFLMILALQLYKDPAQLNNCDYLYKKSRKIPRLDYKVRDLCHDFLIKLFDYAFKIKSVNELSVTDQRWFSHQYETDATIENILKNLRIIIDFIEGINKKNEFYNYILNNVKLSFFADEDRGYECESLYIYINGRGKKLSPYETIKALYLDSIDDIDKKHKVGTEFEDWQSYFWKKHYEKDDADDGFNLFLKRVEYINTCLSVDRVSASPSRLPSTICFENLPNFENLHDFFNAYQFIADELFPIFNNKENFIEVPQPLISEFRFIQSIFLESSVKTKNFETLKRYVRFFYNVSRNDNVEKAISTVTPQSIRLIDEYIESNPQNIDVTDLINYKGRYTMILTPEELIKLNLYKNPPSGIQRQALETVFWKSEDFYLNNGSIIHLINWSTVNEEFSFKRYIKIWSNYHKLFENTDSQISEANILMAFYCFIRRGTLPTFSSSWKGTKYLPFDWNYLSRSEPVKHLCSEYSTEDLTNIDIFRAKILHPLINTYLSKYDKVSIKIVASELEQVLILWILSYKWQFKKGKNIKLWPNGFNIGVWNKNENEEKESIFVSPSVIYSIGYNFMDYDESWTGLISKKTKMDIDKQIEFLLEPI